jgi:lipoic acid synthetase
MSELLQIGPETRRRPEWLKIRLASGEQYANYQALRSMVSELGLNTVCVEARCPNIHECWGEHRTATFMILGDVCTRRCGFCAVTSGRPAAGVDAGEPDHVAEAVARLRLRHAVITSVDRDDLPDAGAGHFAQVIRAIRGRNADCAVEVLTPDFKGAPEALDTVLDARPEVFSHNIETVPRLYRDARPGSRYDGSLGLLAAAAARKARAAAAGEQAGTFRLKTGIMAGLGETRAEISGTLRDIRGAGVEVFTIGQYLQPTTDHLPVARFVPPEEFAEIRAEALGLGFLHVEAGPLVRSSYHAHEHVPARAD